MAIQYVRELEPVFGEPTLAAANNSEAYWVRGLTSPLDQKSPTGWLACLYGGDQTNDDWARVNIPVFELPVAEFKSAMWSYYMTDDETMGVNMVIWIHDPKDFDKRAEVTQLANIATLEKAEGWNAHELNTGTTQFFFYGEGTTGTGLTAGTQYTWAQFQADDLFKTWTIYRITLEYGWEASGTFDRAYVADVKLNGMTVYMRPNSNDNLDDYLPCIGRESLAVSNSSVGLASIKVNATVADIYNDGQNIRVTFDGTAPVKDTTGRIVYSTQSFKIMGKRNIRQFRAIRDGDTNSKLQVDYYGVD